MACGDLGAEISRLNFYSLGLTLPTAEQRPVFNRFDFEGIQVAVVWVRVGWRAGEWKEGRLGSEGGGGEGDGKVGGDFFDQQENK